MKHMNIFPPTDSKHLYIYQNHYDALMQHQHSVHTLLLDTSTDGCLSRETMDVLTLLAGLLDKAINFGRIWVSY